MVGEFLEFSQDISAWQRSNLESGKGHTVFGNFSRPYEFS